MKRLFAAAAVASAALAASAVQAADPDPAAGKKVYDQACFACHATGAANAPKLGDVQAWAPRIDKGMDTLVKHAIEGFQGDKGFMPAKGGRSDLSDKQVADAVAYMVSQVKQ